VPVCNVLELEEIGRMGRPDISIITATFHAPALLQRAIESVLMQDCTSWELVISPDDGIDYSALEKIDPRIKVVRSTLVKSGPGAARNRAVAIASGKYVVTLDDDDILQHNFVRICLDGLKTNDAVAVPIAYVREDGTLIREVGNGVASIDICGFGRLLGSLVMAGKRDSYFLWGNCFAEDVIHACQIIDAVGGRVVVLQGTRYCCTVRSGSICATREDIDGQYAAILRGISSQVFGKISAAGISAMRELFQFRRDINAQFERRENRSCSYHDFVEGSQSEVV
jgi:glycosyltransferase involved in cell wall biosynthesis